MIIVTGPDNGGKTTLVRKLVDDMGLDNMEKCKTLPLWAHHNEYTNWIVNTFKESTHVSVVDRCYIDELVYGPIMRGKICFDAIDTYRIQKAFLDVKPLIILADPGPNKLMERYGEREQYPDISDNLTVQSRFYKELQEHPFTEVPKYIFDYRFDPEYKLVKKVVAYYISKGGRP